MTEIRRILCPIDFSPQSDKAADHALALATAMGAELTLIHVLSEPALALEESGGFQTPNLVAEYTEHMTQKLTEVASRLRPTGAPVPTKILRGPIHEAIVEEAKAEHSDLIVMGTHGRTGIQHVLLGSMAERVVRLAPVPVMTVRAH